MSRGWAKEREELAALIVRVREVDPVDFERWLDHVRWRAAQAEPPGPLRKAAGWTTDARYWRGFIKNKLKLPIVAQTRQAP